MSPRILTTHTPALLREAVDVAAARLRAGAVVAVPTETVYGLAADALDPVAVARIYAIKGRPPSNPLIVHVAGIGMAQACASEWTPLADRLARVFWPGPLTLVVPRGAGIPDIVTAGGDTVALRWPRHPFMQGVIQACGFPLAAPSANLSNNLSPTSAAHVQAGLGDRVELIVDGGDCNVGIESTVVDCTGPVPRVLRPGILSAEEILAAAGLPAGGRPPGASADPTKPGVVLRSPGMLERHYAPRSRLIVRKWRDADELRRLVAAAGEGDPHRVWVIAHDRVPVGTEFPHVVLIPEDPEAYARALYGELHRCDAAGAGLIVVEQVPDSPGWEGVADRLRRASAAADAPTGAGTS